MWNRVYSYYLGIIFDITSFYLNELLYDKISWLTQYKDRYRALTFTIIFMTIAFTFIKIRRLKREEDKLRWENPLRKKIKYWID
ncbi:hypothetical protein IGL01_002337 [Enterococcus sp. DIV0340]|uniref:hypothetical protein n=1 Tax=unclassified Enterococcus TaxID=2608891 RepID=UPI0022ADC4AD|nr:hypothetical protein [Enterococcus faecalis]